MSATQLIPCAHCARFVRSNESSCPFCARALTAHDASPRPSTEGLSRSAIVALTVALAAAACDGGSSASQSTNTTTTTTSSGNGTSTDGTSSTPTTDTAAADSGVAPTPTTTPGDGTMMQTRYGAPPFVSFDA
ncbi:MAG: hypothetical protein JNK05_25330 [Myxococcales bacterium]|nr:hypothetical protein [Myxococcales bacterium]